MAGMSCITSAAVGRPCVSILRSVRRLHSQSHASVCNLLLTCLPPSRLWGTRVSSSQVREERSRLGVTQLRPRFFNVKAADLSQPGAVDSPLMSSMQSKIRESLNAQEVSVTDAYGDGRHVSIDVVAEAFEGQSRVGRQRMVYKAIWEELQSTVHAVDQLRTRTPSEVAASGKSL